MALVGATWPAPFGDPQFKGAHLARTFYRIVHSREPSLSEFAPRPSLLVLTDPLKARRATTGISAYATEAQARRKAKQLHWEAGRYIARLELPDDTPVEVDRWERGGGHHTLYGPPAALRSYVTDIVLADTEGVE